MSWTDPPLWVASAKVHAHQMNPHVRGNLLFLKECIACGDAEVVLIATDEATITQSYVELNAETGTADDLANLTPDRTGLGEGTIVILRAATGDTITLKDETAGTGDLAIGDDIVLENGKHVMLIRGAVNWQLLYSPTDVTFCVNAFQYPAPGTGWTPELRGASLGASLSTKKVWLPLNFLKVGDEIISYTLKGDVIFDTAPTLDCKLVRVNLADPITTDDVAGGDITQITIDGDFSSLATLTAAETVAIDKQYTLEILGTTQASEAIIVMGAEVVIRRN